MSKAKRPFSGATKAAHKRKFARLPNDPIEMELWRLDSKAATSTANTTDAESRLQNYKKSQEDGRTGEMFLELLRALPAEGQCILGSGYCWPG